MFSEYFRVMDIQNASTTLNIDQKIDCISFQSTSTGMYLGQFASFLCKQPNYM